MLIVRLLFGISFFDYWTKFIQWGWDEIGEKCSVKSVSDLTRRVDTDSNSLV